MRLDDPAPDSLQLHLSFIVASGARGTRIEVEIRRLAAGEPLLELSDSRIRKEIEKFPLLVRELIVRANGRLGGYDLVGANGIGHTESLADS